MNRKLGDHEINHMLKEKEKFMLNPRNYAMYKSKLKKDLDTAIATGQVRRNQQVMQTCKRRVIMYNAQKRHLLLVL